MLGKYFKSIRKHEASELLTQVNKMEWQQDYRIGVGTQCTCGRAFFIYNLRENPEHPTIEPVIREDHIFPIYCPDCEFSFISSDMICPTCNHQY